MADTAGGDDLVDSEVFVVAGAKKPRRHLAFVVLFGVLALALLASAMAAVQQRQPIGSVTLIALFAVLGTLALFIVTVIVAAAGRRGRVVVDLGNRTLHLEDVTFRTGLTSTRPASESLSFGDIRSVSGRGTTFGLSVTIETSRGTVVLTGMSCLGQLLNVLTYEVARNRCATCGYNLTGTPSKRCPECGSPRYSMTADGGAAPELRSASINSQGTDGGSPHAC